MPKASEPKFSNGKNYIIVVGILFVFTVLVLGALILWEEPEELIERFILIVLPETQNYSKEYPYIFTNQTKWIYNQKEDKNIVFVSHQGDIVDKWDSNAQWKNARTSMDKLEDIPYGMAIGNHDMSSKRDTEHFNQYFSFNNSYPDEKNDNNYQLFSIGKDDYIILHLGFCPTSDVIDWANGILEDYSNKRAIITTHGYINDKAERDINVSVNNKGGCETSSNNTQYLWDELIYPNSNVFLVLSGHVHNEARRIDNNIADKPVYQLLSNYQGRDDGGSGWLRILEFVPSQDKIYVKTYSPYLDEYELDEDSDFILDYDMTEL